MDAVCQCDWKFPLLEALSYSCRCIDNRVGGNLLKDHSAQCKLLHTASIDTQRFVKGGLLFFEEKGSRAESSGMNEHNFTLAQGLVSPKYIKQVIDGGTYTQTNARRKAEWQQSLLSL